MFQTFVKQMRDVTISCVECFSLSTVFIKSGTQSHSTNQNNKQQHNFKVENSNDPCRYEWQIHILTHTYTRSHAHQIRPEGKISWAKYVVECLRRLYVVVVVDDGVWHSLPHAFFPSKKTANRILFAQFASDFVKDNTEKTYSPCQTHT